MHNVAPSRALSRRQRQLVIIAFVAAALGAFIAVAGVALFFIEVVGTTSPNYGLYGCVRGGMVIGGIIAFLVGAGLGVRAATLKTDNDLAMVTGRYISRFFDARFHFIRNVNKPRIGYIDAVLIGPPGVLVFRIMGNTGIFANEGANWLRQDTRGQWVPAGVEPTREAVEDVRKLREFVQAQNLGDVPVYGVVLFTKEEPAARIATQEPTVPVAHLSNLIQTLTPNYLAKERIDAQRVERLARLLYEA
jgi:hypothetical protein